MSQRGSIVDIVIDDNSGHADFFEAYDRHAALHRHYVRNTKRPENHWLADQIIILIPRFVRRRIVMRFLRAKAQKGQYLCSEVKYGNNGNLTRWERIR